MPQETTQSTQKTLRRAVGEPPPTPPEPFTCEWAKAGLAAALDGMNKSAGGVTEYWIGTRKVKRSGPADAVKSVDYWNQMVQLCCAGETPLPPALTGRDSVRRVVLTDT